MSGDAERVFAEIAGYVRIQDKRFRELLATMRYHHSRPAATLAAATGLGLIDALERDHDGHPHVPDIAGKKAQHEGQV